MSLKEKLAPVLFYKMPSLKQSQENTTQEFHLWTRKVFTETNQVKEGQVRKKETKIKLI